MSQITGNNQVTLYIFFSYKGRQDFYPRNIITIAIPISQELGFNEITGAAECRCPKNLLYWPATDRCYEEHSRGPCEINQYLVSEITSEAIEKNNLKNRYASENNSRTLVGEKNLINKKVRCKNTKICANGWIFWPSMQECFQLYTQGPCHKVSKNYINFEGRIKNNKL